MKQECITQTRDFIEGVYAEFIDLMKDEDVDYRSGASAFRRELILALAREEKPTEHQKNKKKDKDKKREEKKDAKKEKNKSFTSREHTVKKFLGESTEGFKKILSDGKI